MNQSRDTGSPGRVGRLSPGGRLALFGGSFDPPHRGHLAIARAAANAFALTNVVFVPAGRQPLKSGGAVASYGSRLAMVNLACLADPRFAASDLDAPRPDGRPNYTVDTLETLRRQNPKARLFAIAGADAFLDLPRWYESARLFDLAEWIVVSRPNFPLRGLSALGLTEAQRARVHLLDTVHDSVSATDLRSRLRSGERCDDLLPEVVERYIRQHRLYGELGPASPTTG